MSLNYVLTSRDCFGLHINITHPDEKTENVLPIVDFNHLSLADYHKDRRHLFTAASKKEKKSYLSSCNYATIPAAIITHPSHDNLLQFPRHHPSYLLHSLHNNHLGDQLSISSTTNKIQYDNTK